MREDAPRAAKTCVVGVPADLEVAHETAEVAEVLAVEGVEGAEAHRQPVRHDRPPPLASNPVKQPRSDGREIPIRLDGGAANEAGCFRFDDTADELQYSDDCTTFTSFVDIAGTPGGNDTEVQYNNSGNFAGDPGFTYNAGTDTLTVGTAINVGETITITGQAGAAPTFAALNDLSNVNTSPADGDLLVYNNTSGDWETIAQNSLSITQLWADDGPEGPAEIYRTGGDVGIGTNNPSYELEIWDGTAATLGLQVDGAGATDIVMMDLSTLSSVSNSLDDAGTKGWRIRGYGDAWGTAASQNDFNIAYGDGGTFTDATCGLVSCAAAED